MTIKTTKNITSKANKKFVKAPLTVEKQEELRKKFIELSPFQSVNEEDSESLFEKSLKGTKKNKQLLLRIPETYFEKIKQLSKLTGLTRNALCSEILLNGIRKKLTELKELLE